MLWSGSTGQRRTDLLPKLRLVPQYKNRNTVFEGLGPTRSETGTP